MPNSSIQAHYTCILTLHYTHSPGYSRQNKPKVTERSPWEKSEHPSGRRVHTTDSACRLRHGGEHSTGKCEKSQKHLVYPHIYMCSHAYCRDELIALRYLL